MSKVKTETKAEELAELCTICDRVAFGSIVRTGFGKWRHDYCGIGSSDWLVYYQGLTEEKKKPLQPFFIHVYPQVDESQEKGAQHEIEETT